MFRQYHYLNGSLGAGVRCYTAIYQEKPVGFIAVACVRMKAKYYRVSRLVVLPDYQGIGVGKRLLNFIAEQYVSQTKVPFYILTGNPQIIRGNMDNWRIMRYGHASKGKGDTRINNEIRSSLSRNRITMSLLYILKKKSSEESFSFYYTCNVSGIANLAQ
jgi:GNAT superfamily N-acetyltransferase